LTFAENGKEAVERAAKQTFDLILMDMQMPVMDGLEAARHIREDESARGRPRIRMLALTADADHQAIRLSHAAGLDGHVAKPVTKKALLAAIESFTPPVQAEVKSMPVEVAPGFGEAARVYIRSTKLEMAKLRALAEAKEFEQLRVLAHEIRGSGAGYGFPDVTRVAELVALSAGEGNMARVNQHLMELARYTQRAEEMLIAAQEI
jgi:CheY-like chemotaxis protein